MTYLVRDLLDRRIVDCEGSIVGRVDGVGLEIRRDAPPRVGYLAVGGGAAHARIGRWYAALGMRMRRLLGHKRSTGVRIPWRQVDHVGRDVRLLVEARHVDTRVWERWARQHIVGRLPGAAAK